MRDLRARVEDAQLLWSEDRREGAFLMALVAVAARSREAFPPPIRDRDAFERFIRSRLSVRLSLEFRGKQEPWESILYKWMRCELVHDGGLPTDLRFMEDAEPGELSARAGGAPDYVVLVSPAWFDQLSEWALA